MLDTKFQSDMNSGSERVLTIYGHGDLGHLTLDFYVQLTTSLNRDASHMKFGFIRPSRFREDV